MMDFQIARMQIEREMERQFEEAPDTGQTPVAPSPRGGIVTTLRLHLSADLRALAAVIEPRQPLTPKPASSHR